MRSGREDVRHGHSEAGQVGLGRDLLTLVEELGLGVGAVDENCLVEGIDFPDQGDPRVEVVADLIGDRFGRIGGVRTDNASLSSEG